MPHTPEAMEHSPIDHARRRPAPPLRCTWRTTAGHEEGHGRRTGGIDDGLSNIGSRRANAECGLVDIGSGDPMENSRVAETAYIRGPQGQRFLRRLGLLIAQDGARADPAGKGVGPLEPLPSAERAALRS